MKRKKIIKRFQKIRQSTQANTRAPHKPLLLLYTIGRLLKDKDHLFSYSEIDKHLGKLLEEFGPSQTKSRTHYPFWRLKNDKIWEIPDPNKKYVRRTSKKDPFKSDLCKYNITGGFPKAIANQFLDDSKLVSEIIQILLYNNFPYSIHEDILQAVEIESPLQIYQWQIPDSKQRKRDSKFRENILKIYEFKCAVCGFDAKLDAKPIALEAAHIKWHMHDGPDVVDNGLALCSLHHKLFDRGAFTLSRKQEVFISKEVLGTMGFEEWLINFHLKQINLPEMICDYPAQEYIDWHAKVIFRGNYSNS